MNYAIGCRSGMNDSEGHKVTCGITPQLAVATPTGDPPLVESPGIAVVKTNTTATLVNCHTNKFGLFTLSTTSFRKMTSLFIVRSQAFFTERT